MDFLQKSGIFGLPIILFFFLLLVISIIVVAITRSRRAVLTFSILAFIPLFLGVLGTVIGNIAVSKETQRFPANLEVARAMEAEARREARIPIYLGSGATVALLMACGCGFAFTKKKSNKTLHPTAGNAPV
jgi:hypothetical protein